MKKRLPDYLSSDYFSQQFDNNFSALLLCKINISNIFDLGGFFRFLIYHEVLKFLSDQNFSWKHMCIVKGTLHTYTEKNISEFFLFFIGIIPQGIENRKIYYLKGSIYYCESEITG